MSNLNKYHRPAILNSPALFNNKITDGLTINLNKGFLMEKNKDIDLMAKTGLSNVALKEDTRIFLAQNFTATEATPTTKSKILKLAESLDTDEFPELIDSLNQIYQDRLKEA